MPNDAQLLEDSLLVVWNDRDAERRLESMKKIYSPDIQFFESNAGEAIVGFQALNALIARLQSGWPLEFQFELNKPSQVNHQTQIISWNLGVQGDAPAATGMDVAFVENDLIKCLYLFLDVPE